MLSDVCLSRTFGLSREQRGLIRPKLAHRYPMSHVTWTPLSRSKGQTSTCRERGHIVAAFCTAPCHEYVRSRSKGQRSRSQGRGHIVAASLLQLVYHVQRPSKYVFNYHCTLIANFAHVTLLAFRAKRTRRTLQTKFRK